MSQFLAQQEGSREFTRARTDMGTITPAGLFGDVDHAEVGTFNWLLLGFSAGHKHFHIPKVPCKAFEEVCSLQPVAALPLPHSDTRGGRLSQVSAP